MKKITAILVCLLLVASFAITAFAADVEMTLTADKTSLTRGETVTLTIAMPELAGCKSGGFNLEGLYDTAVLEFVSGECPLDGTMLENVGYISNKLSGSFMYASATTVSGPIFTVTMKVKDDAAFGKTTVSPTVSARTSGALEAVINSLELNIVCTSHTEKTEVTKEATCKEAGEKVTTCTECGATLKTEAIAKLAHTEVTTTTKEATCKEAGEKVTSCSVCNEVIKTDAIAKLPHTEVVTTTKEATCKEAGEKVTSCSVCNEVIKTEAIAKLPHTEKTEVTKEATCSEAGEKVTTCTVCGETKTEAIAKLAHTWDEGVLTKEMTCEEDGEVTYTCTVCEATEVVAIDKLPHDFDEGTVTKDPTTKAEGEKTYTCKDCGATKTEAIAKLETPKTDDNSMIVAFVALMVLSAAGLAVTVIGKKRAI